MAVIGFTSDDKLTVRGANLVMAPAAWFVLVPLAHASLLSGIALSLGTAWGLFRHYWVVLKLLITVFATVILLIYMGTFRQMAGVAADPVVDLSVVRYASPIVHAILALVLLLAATALGVYKPFGMTAYGRRKQPEQRQAFSPAPARPQALRTDAPGTSLWVTSEPHTSHSGTDVGGKEADQHRRETPGSPLSRAWRHQPDRSSNLQRTR